MTTQLQQALNLTQTAVGQLQGMFKRLAGKMEVDVATLKTGLQDAIRAVQKLTQDVQTLRVELDQVRGELTRVRAERMAPPLTRAPTLKVVNGRSRPVGVPGSGGLPHDVVPAIKMEIEDADFHDAAAED